MSWRKDLKSEPKNGRFFPLRFGDAVRLVKENGFVDFSGDRIKVRMENTENETKYGFPIADIFPEEDLAIYSLPDNLPSQSCQKLAVEAISKLAKV